MRQDHSAALDNAVTVDLNDLGHAIAVKIHKANNMMISAGQDLIEARKRIAAGEGDGITWADWLRQHDIGAEKAKVCLRIANAPDPKQALAVHQKKDATRKREKRAEVKTTGTDVQSDQFEPVTDARHLAVVKPSAQDPSDDELYEMVFGDGKDDPNLIVIKDACFEAGVQFGRETATTPATAIGKADQIRAITIIWNQMTAQEKDSLRDQLWADPVGHAPLTWEDRFDALMKEDDADRDYVLDHLAKVPGPERDTFRQSIIAPDMAEPVS